MNRETIIQAWRSRTFHSKLGASEQAALPDNPAGSAVLTAEELARVSGMGNGPGPINRDPNFTLPGGILHPLC